MIISFLDDDIDKPYVSSSLYNGANPSLVNLPFNDHQTSLSSKTIGVNEEGYNELTLGVLIALIIFISLTYHFLQRPLELIFWDRYDISKLSINNKEKNFKTMKTVNYSYFR
ncbi:hypothetical protein ACU4EF_00535 (plasmid) [Campylobacter jejuni]